MTSGLMSASSCQPDRGEESAMRAKSPTPLPPPAGTDLKEAVSYGPSSTCNVPCSGNADEICGGGYCVP